MTNNITKELPPGLLFLPAQVHWVALAPDTLQPMMDLWIDERRGEVRRLWADLISAAEHGRGWLGPKTMVDLLDEALRGDYGDDSKLAARYVLQALLQCWNEERY